MKPNAYTGFIMALAALILAGGWTTSVWAQQVRDPIAAIINIKGTVEWREDASVKEWKPAERDQHLYEGNELRTGELSRAMIAFSATAAAVSINEKSELVVQSTQGRFQRKKDRVNMFVGEVYTKVTKDKEFEVETPSSVASVRGTEFDMSHIGGWTTLVVVDGIVELLSKLQQAMQEATERTRTVVDEEGTITPPVIISSDDVDDAVDWAGEVEPTWRLKLDAEEGEGTFIVHIRAIDRMDNLLDTDCNIALTSLTSDMPEVLFSTDEGASWNAQPFVKLSEGEAKVMAKSAIKGKANVHAIGGDCAPGILPITFIEQAKTIKLIIEFTDDEGNKKQYEIEVQKKEE